MNESIITLTREEYDRMMFKAMCWELYRTSLINDTGYVNDTERLLFDVPKADTVKVYADSEVAAEKPAEEVNENA